VFTTKETWAVILLLTSGVRDIPLARVLIEASPETGLQQRSFAMLDRITTAPCERVGRVDAVTMHAVNRALAVFLGIA
jgi:mRNA interferase MazF